MEGCLEEFKGDCDDSMARLYESVESAYLYTCEAFMWEGEFELESLMARIEEKEGRDNTQKGQPQ